MDLRDKYFYIEFEIISLERFQHLQVMFEKLKEVKNDWMGFCDSEAQESNLEYQDPVEDFDWHSYLDNEARVWFEDTFDYDSEEGKTWCRLRELTHYQHRDRPFLITPGNWDFESMLDSIFNGEYCLASLNQEENSRGCLYYEPFGHPFGGSDSLCELIRAFGNKVIYDSWHENDNPPIESQWNYELAKELVQKGIGFTPEILENL
jgi:hypothetical protein